MTRANGQDEIDYPMTGPITPSGPWPLMPSLALPEAFFHDERHNLKYLFKDLSKTVDAMRRIVDVLPRGEGLGRATRAYFSLLWKQRSAWGRLTKRGRNLSWGTVDQMREPWSYELTRKNQEAYDDSLYCFETLFYKMCEAANNNGRGIEIQGAFPRPRLLLEAVILSDGCVEGLKIAGLQIDDHDYETTLAELMALRQSIEARAAAGRAAAGSLPRGSDWKLADFEPLFRANVKKPLRDLELAVERLDKWRQL